MYLRKEVREIKLVHNGRKHKVFSSVKIPKSTGKHAKHGFLYFCRIGDETSRVFKIGTTNSILYRMKQHAAYFGQPIYLLWVSPKYSKYTTLRVEDRQKEFWIENTNWEYVTNDRFIIPENVTEIQITVKNNWDINLEQD